MKGAEMRIQGSSYAVKASRGSLYPRLNLTGAMNSNYSSIQEQSFNPDGGYQFGDQPIAFVNKDLTSPVFGVRLLTSANS